MNRPSGVPGRFERVDANAVRHAAPKFSYQRADKTGHASFETGERWPRARAVATRLHGAANDAAVFLLPYRHGRKGAAHAQLLRITGEHAGDERPGQMLKNFRAEFPAHEIGKRFVIRRRF